MNILIAPNAFKNSLTADLVAEAISKGLQQSKLSCKTSCFPVGDGGDGTARLLLQHLKGKIINASVHDPLNRKINSSFGLTDNDKTAIIELADASGLRLLKSHEYDPLHATTYGTGELILHALDKNINKIILCIGGSATVDGGVGILQALGVKFLNEKGYELLHLPASLAELDSIDTTNLDKRLNNIELIILCDVENYLLGKEGAAPVFGPQKGASKEMLQKLEAGLTRLRNIFFNKTGNDIATIKHGGAAGGVAAGLHAFINAKLVNGIDYFLDATGFNNALLHTDLVITGEGSIDEQTLHGKGPFGVAKRAKEQSIPVIGLAGSVPLMPNEQLQNYFDILLPVNNEITDIKIAMANSYDNLVRSSKLIGGLLNISPK